MTTTDKARRWAEKVAAARQRKASVSEVAALLQDAGLDGCDIRKVKALSERLAAEQRQAALASLKAAAMDEQRDELVRLRRAELDEVDGRPFEPLEPAPKPKKARPRKKPAAKA